MAAKEPLDDVISGTIQTCLLLLIDLVYRLVLFGSVPTAVDQHGLLSATIVMGNDGNDNIGSSSGGGTVKARRAAMVAAWVCQKCRRSQRSLRANAREFYKFFPRSGGATGGVVASLSLGMGGVVAALASEALQASSLLLCQALHSSIMGNPPPVTASSGFACLSQLLPEGYGMDGG